jgi:hypothetical protein
LLLLVQFLLEPINLLSIVCLHLLLLTLGLVQFSSQLFHLVFDSPIDLAVGLLVLQVPLLPRQLAVLCIDLVFKLFPASFHLLLELLPLLPQLLARLLQAFPFLLRFNYRAMQLVQLFGEVTVLLSQQLIEYLLFKLSGNV